MSYRGKGRGGRWKSGSSSSSYASKFSEHDDRAVPQRNDFDRADGFRGKMTSHRGSSRRGGGSYYRGNRGHNNEFRGNYRSNRSRRPYGQRGGRRGSSRGSDNLDSPFHQDEDGDTQMADDDSDVGSVRFKPYARPRRERFPKPSGQAAQKKESWYKITILNGSKMDEEWLHQEIQSTAMVQFQLFEYHVENENTTFFVEDRSTAEAIRSCSKRISSPDGTKVILLMKPANNPPMSQSLVEEIKVVLGNRFNSELLHLDLSSMYHEEKLRSNRVKLTTFYHAFVVGRIIADHIPSLLSIDLSNNSLSSSEPLKYLVSRTPSVKKLSLKKNQFGRFQDLSNLKMWDLVELTIDQNPLCPKYKTQAEYISDAREYFPNLLILDNHPLPPPVKFDIDSGSLPKPVRDCISTTGQNMIGRFIQQYFQCYDQSRSDLFGAYSEGALFSVTLPSSPRGPSLVKYLDFNRNLKKFKKGSSAKITKLSSGRTEVLAKLSQLPPTQHILTSFAIDVPLMSDAVINFIVRGLFREKGTNEHLRAFSRCFFCEVSEASVKIANEQYFIRNPTAAEIKESKAPAASQPAPVAPQASTSQQAEMLAAFATQSGMNAKYSQQCLIENGWDYEKAGMVFLQLKNEGKIPAEAFLK